MVFVDASVLQGWDQVFLGHYHAPQLISENIEYVGSPWQINYSEAFQKKHLVVYDLITHEKQYIVNTFSPKHFIYTPEQSHSHVFEEEAFIKIKTDNIKSSENVEIQKALLENKFCKEAKVEPIRKTNGKEKHVIQSAKAILFKEEEMAQEYIKEVGTKGLKQEQLLKVFQFICKKRDEND
jgi:DNA repair exonuclease SbcCD nuclease subunit